MTSKLIRKFLNLIESKTQDTKFKTTSDIIFEIGRASCRERV